MSQPSKNAPAHPATPVLVIGATGSQGGAVARALLRRGLPVRALTRRPSGEAARALLALGAELAEGDLDDAGSLRRAMEGVRGVYALTDFFQNGIAKEIEHGERMVDVAKEVGVPHFVFASVADCDRAPEVPHFASKHRIEQHIKASGLPATLLRPTIFMEDLTEKKYVPPASWGTMSRVVGQDTKIGWVAVDDIGEVAATVFADPARHIGRTLTLMGDRLSMAEARALFTEVRGKKPFALPMPAWLFRLLVSKELHAMWGWLKEGGFEDRVEETRALHPGARSMRAWLTAKVAAERGQEGSARAA